jgi:hypothetical protein
MKKPGIALQYANHPLDPHPLLARCLPGEPKTHKPAPEKETGKNCIKQFFAKTYEKAFWYS